ncbi:MAG: biopolymer transporter ExbD [Balneolales bacterium]
MKSGGFLLRFVDVVLILLFGFIVISDLDEDTQIILPESEETESAQPDLEQVQFISITGTGEYLHEAENLQFENLDDLESYIQSLKNQLGETLKIRIRANHDSQVKHAIAVAQICDLLEVKKAIDVKLMTR